MSKPYSRAIVIGAGIAGMAAAAALSEGFEKVVVLERDWILSGAVPRPGVPQSYHAHGLLGGGLKALGQLFGGFESKLKRAGAVAIRSGLDVREEGVDGEVSPQRDLGLGFYSMSRPLLEAVIRDSLREICNIEIRTDHRVASLVVSENGDRVVGAKLFKAKGEDPVLADLVVDATGSGKLINGLLGAIGRRQPAETAIRSDILYATAVVEIPREHPRDWKLAHTAAIPPNETKSAVIAAIEGNRWILTLAGRHGDWPSPGRSGLLAYLRGLRTSTIYDAVKAASLGDQVHRFAFPESSWRHYERLDDLPSGIVPLGDTFCRFNPVYGQGMSVAAQEAVILSSLVAAFAERRAPLDELNRAFLADVTPLLEAVWSMAAIPELAYPQTRGERPANLEAALDYRRRLRALAREEPGVQQLFMEVLHLLRPYEDLRTSPLVAGLQAAPSNNDEVMQ